MKFRLEESTPGEFERLGADSLREHVDVAVHEAVRALDLPDPLCKGGRGTIRAIDELGDLMVAKYQERARALAEEVATLISQADLRRG